MRRTVIISVVLVILILTGTFFGVKLYNIHSEYEEYDKIYENIESAYSYNKNPREMSFGSDDSNSNIEDLRENGDIKEPLYTEVDMDGLYSMNSDIVGWICIPDTKVSYPIVKSHDNNEYLTMTADKKNARCGAIFMDCMNSGLFEDDNTVIYGHNMSNGSMFHELLSYKKQDFYDNHKEVIIIDLYGEEHEFDIIGAYKTLFDAQDYILSFSSYNAVSFEKHLDYVKEKTVIECKPYDEGKNIVTLSTCVRHGSDERFVVVLQEKDKL